MEKIEKLKFVFKLKIKNNIKARKKKYGLYSKTKDRAHKPNSKNEISIPVPELSIPVGIIVYIRQSNLKFL